MRILNRQEALLLDQLANKEFHIPIEKLIANVAQNLLQELEKRVSLTGKKIKWNQTFYEGFIFLIGPGNNGKDGLLLKELILKKYPNISCGIYEYAELKSFLEFKNKKKWIVIDAIFGVGLDRKLPEAVIQTLSKINKEKKKFSVIAIDVPTGLNSNTGTSFGGVLKADLTLTCELPKVGFFFNEGPLVTGEIKSISVGFPQELVAKVATQNRLLQYHEIQKIKPRKFFHGNKTKYGHLLVVAGSDKMPGALRLSSEAAARAGVGYVTVALEEKLFSKADFMKKIFPDFILAEKSELLKISAQDLKSQYSGVLFGPGLEKNLENLNLLKKLLQSEIKILIDAQGLNMLAEEGLSLHENCVVTPHSGELSRLIGRSASLIDQDKVQACEIFVKKYKSLILAKGAKSVLHVFGKNYIINSGNKALAKAGTGDVLSGMISSYMAQGLSLEKAICYGTYLHGYLADLWIKKGNSASSLMASDLIEMLKLNSSFQRVTGK